MLIENVCKQNYKSRGNICRHFYLTCVEIRFCCKLRQFCYPYYSTLSVRLLAQQHQFRINLKSHTVYLVKNLVTATFHLACLINFLHFIILFQFKRFYVKNIPGIHNMLQSSTTLNRTILTRGNSVQLF